jgi:hypothetical protein
LGLREALGERYSVEEKFGITPSLLSGREEGAAVFFRLDSVEIIDDDGND